MGSQPDKAGAVIVVSGPSGSGKTTILKRILDEDPELVWSVSATTRSPREGEVDGVDYLFLSPEQFDEKIVAGEFSEWARSFSEYYGTPGKPLQDAIDSGRVMVLDLDIQGVRRIKQNVPDAILVLIAPPDLDELIGRLRKRSSETEEQLAMRVERARHELDGVDEYDHVIVNDDLDTAVAELRNVIDGIKERRRGEGN